jgi:integrase
VAIPLWVKHGIDAWMIAAKIEDGRLLRPLSKSGKLIGDELGDWAIWSVVEQSAKQIGIERFGAHDLRRTCANVWSAALSQAKSEVTGWSAQMYSTFGGVCDSWPGWNALRPLPI